MARSRDTRKRWLNGEMGFLEELASNLPNELNVAFNTHLDVMCQL